MSVHLSALASERWLSPQRRAIHLAVAGGKHDLALALYAWNAQLSVACMQDIGHLEVMVRNRRGARLTRRSTDWTYSASPLWSRETGIERARRKQARLNHGSRKQLKEAAERAPHRTHEHIVANLSFGFWTSLTRSEREATIWTPYLSSSFAGISRGAVRDHMVKLSAFRNRLAHWEPVFSRTTGFARQLRRVDDLFTTAEPEVASWVGAHSNVFALLDAAPIPVLGDLPRVRYLGRTLRVRLLGREPVADRVDELLKGLGE